MPLLPTTAKLASAALALGLALSPARTFANGLDPAARGLAIARSSDRANEGFGGEKGTMALDIVNAHGEVTKRQLVMEVLEGTSDGDRSRAVFEWPADVKGTKLLTWSHKTSDDDQWLYLPAMKRVKRISSANKTGSFMGSEFSYEDLGSQEVEKYTYKLLDEPSLGGRATFRLERTPVDKASGYARQVVWTDKEHLQPLRIEYYDRKNELLKTASFDGYKKIGKHWRFTTIRMENVQTRKKSILTWTNRQLGVKLAAESFDSGRLEN